VENLPLTDDPGLCEWAFRKRRGVSKEGAQMRVAHKKRGHAEQKRGEEWGGG